MREIDCKAPALPGAMTAVVAGYRWRRDMVGEAGAAVHCLHAPGRPDLYLKHGAGVVAQDVVDEMARLRWLRGRMPVPELRHFVTTADEAWLLTTALHGRTAYEVMADDPAAHVTIAAAIARFLREWHRLPVDDCPFEAGHRVRMGNAAARMRAGAIDTDDFGDAHRGWSAEQVWDRMAALVPAAPDRVVTHGDFSVAECIDLGQVGIATGIRTSRSCGIVSASSAPRCSTSSLRPMACPRSTGAGSTSTSASTSSSRPVHRSIAAGC